jgi:pimeloyl-ACP methyl ester carboxylesterase
MIEEIQFSANSLEWTALSAGTGQPVLLAHGFPETPATFDRTIEHLAARGFRAVAPYMRGYHPRTVKGIERFHANALAEDLLAIADELSPSAPAILIGHDWGAFATYRAAAMRPERWSKIITLGIPHPAMIRPSLRLAWGLRHFVVFQLEGWALKRLRADDFAEIDAIYRRWAPAWKFGPEETAPVKEIFRHPGTLEGALSYYWHFARQTRDEAKRARELDRSPIPVPAVIVVGRDDAALRPEAVREAPKIFPRGAAIEWIDGAGHFLHREQPRAWLAALDRALQL